MKGKFLVRFVDIVLILLFGFISISEIDTNQKVELPESTESKINAAEIKLVQHIWVDVDGVYYVEDGDVYLNSIDDLRNYLQNKLVQNKNFKIRIRADKNSQIRYAILAAQLCDQLGIEKGLDVIVKATGEA